MRIVGFNWKGVLVPYASTSNLLAGFCITFIALLIGRSIADYQIFKSGLTFAHVSILFFGISAGLFLFASQIFVRAKQFDVYDVPERYYEKLKRVINNPDEIAQFVETQTYYLKKNLRIGRFFYNLSIFLIFIGLFFALCPYNFIIAVIISSVGIGFEVLLFCIYRKPYELQFKGDKILQKDYNPKLTKNRKKGTE